MRAGPNARLRVHSSLKGIFVGHFFVTLVSLTRLLSPPFALNFSISFTYVLFSFLLMFIARQA